MVVEEILHSQQVMEQQVVQVAEVDTIQAQVEQAEQAQLIKGMQVVMVELQIQLIDQAAAAGVQEL